MKEVLERLDKLEAAITRRFDAVDTRLDGVDTRLDRVETRLDRVETRLDHIEPRLDRFEANMNGRFNRLEIAILDLAGRVVAKREVDEIRAKMSI